MATATDSLAAGEPANASEFSANVVVASPWLNPRDPLDVDDDKHVAPSDPLAVINYINEHCTGGGEGESSLQPSVHDSSGAALPDGLMAMLALDLATQAPRRRRS